MIPIWILDGNDPFRLDYLVIAGGGGGSDYNGGGGGGAGGYLCAMPGENSGGPSDSLAQIINYGGESITVTVEAGGSRLANGSNSVFGNLTSTGGGRGADFNTAVGNGGSGGGGASGNDVAGAGTMNQGNTGSDFVTAGSNYPASYQAGAGGGSRTGPVASFDAGYGITSAITGTSVARGGGGGGSAGSGVGRGGYGRDGGGNGAKNGYFGVTPTQATAGTTNSVGGGGGGYQGVHGLSTFAASGGSGIIVLRYPSYRRDISSIAAGLTYAKTTSGSFTVYTFTAGTGTITF